MSATRWASDVLMGLCGIGFLWAIVFYMPHICSIVGAKRCNEMTGRKHG